MQNFAVFSSISLCSSLKRTLLFAASLLMLISASHAGVIEDIFVKDRNLLAVSHYNNLGKADSQTQSILQEINPDTPTANPVLSHLSQMILVESINDIDANNWAEALYFSQPQEKNNDWVYIFHILSPEKYIGALLGTGNIRQEQTEDGITRYRRTDDLDSEVYYLAYGDNNIAIMSQNSSTVARAMLLYNDSEINKSGLIPDSDSDYSLIIHLNRYFLANSRILTEFLSMLHNDIFRDLAGTTAKADNILNLILNYFETTLNGLVNEIAILDLKAYLEGTDIKVTTNIDIQYGGSLHYALSAFDERKHAEPNLLPPDSIMLTMLEHWPEEYTQIIEGIGNLGVSLSNKSIDPETGEKGSKILSTFQQAKPLSSQQGVIAPDNQNNLYGPVAVSVITFEDASRLPELFTLCSSLLSTGDYSEFLAEKGIKIDLKSTTAGNTTTNTPVSETELFMRSTYFNLPDAFIAKQYIISTIIDQHLITVIPLAPLTQIQYYNTRDFCLKALEDTITAIQSPDSTKSTELINTAKKYTTDNSIFSLTVNPLRYLQVAMQAEATWPSPSPPNRLPIPWLEFSQFFNSKEANTPPMNITVNSNRTSISVDLVMPKSTLSSLMQALLNLTPAGGM